MEGEKVYFTEEDLQIWKNQFIEHNPKASAEDSKIAVDKLLENPRYHFLGNIIHNILQVSQANVYKKWEYQGIEDDNPLIDQKQKNSRGSPNEYKLQGMVYLILQRGSSGTTICKQQFDLIKRLIIDKIQKENIIELQYVLEKAQVYEKYKGMQDTKSNFQQLKKKDVSDNINQISAKIDQNGNENQLNPKQIKIITNQCNQNEDLVGEIKSLKNQIINLTKIVHMLVYKIENLEINLQQKNEQSKEIIS